MKKPSISFLSLMILSLVAFLTACGPGLEERGSVTAESESAGGSDSCLQGTWVMSNEDVNALMSSLTTVPGLSIPLGTLVMNFTGNEWSYGSNELLMRADVPGGYMEADALFLYTGNFSTSSGMITFTNVVGDIETLAWRASINGGMEQITGPSAIFFPVPGNGHYNCSGDYLSFEVNSGATGTAGLFFTRQP